MTNNKPMMRVTQALSDAGGGAARERVVRAIQASVILGRFDYHDGWLVDPESLAAWLAAERKRIAKGVGKRGRPPIAPAEHDAPKEPLGNTERHPFIKV